MQLSGSPELGLRFFGFLLIIAYLKLHYKSKSISAHKGGQTPSEIPDLFAILWLIYLFLSSLLIPYSPLLTKSLNLRVNLIPLTQNSPYCLIHAL